MLTASYCLSTNPILRCWGGGEIWTRPLQKRMQSLPPFPPSPQLPLGFRSLRTRAFLARVNSLSPVLPSLDVTDRRGTARSLRQQAHSCDSSALQKKMVLFINLLGKGLTQEISGDRGSIRDGLLTFSLFRRCSWRHKHKPYKNDIPKHKA